MADHADEDARVVSLLAENKRLREALEPFTKFGGPDDGVLPAYHDLTDDTIVLSGLALECITVGNVRAARNAFGILHAPKRR